MGLRRRDEILRVIRDGAVHSQEELQYRLARRGIDVAQPTLSRDLKDLGLAKTAAGYIDPGGDPKAGDAELQTRREERLERALREWVLGVKAAGNLVVVKTPPPAGAVDRAKVGAKDEGRGPRSDGVLRGGTVRAARAAPPRRDRVPVLFREERLSRGSVRAAAPASRGGGRAGCRAFLRGAPRRQPARRRLPCDAERNVGRARTEDPRVGREGHRHFGGIPPPRGGGLPEMVRVRTPGAGPSRRGGLRPHGVVRPGAGGRASRREPGVLPDVGPPRAQARAPSARPWRGGCLRQQERRFGSGEEERRRVLLRCCLLYTSPSPRDRT